MYQERILLTGKDILEKEFKIDTRGYRPQEVDKFLVSGDVESLIEIETVIRTLIKVGGSTEAEFNKAYAAKLAKSGGFDKKLLGLFPDPKPEEDKSTK